MPTLDDDERRLAELGYRQELVRSWSAFSNFAISFSIISILSGCFTTFGQAWMNGGPIAISLGWPLVSACILVIGWCLSELVSAFPTSGGIYWWAWRLGGPRAGFYTGWLNLVGLVAILASVVYGCATFLNITLVSYLWPAWGAAFAGDTLTQQFALFVVLMIVVTASNIFSGHLMATMSNVSVWWHVFGTAAVVLILAVVPERHQSVAWVFTERLNGSGFADGARDGPIFWLYVLPLGFLLTQYTITGFDACAHLSEETQHAAEAAARGLWQSIFYSAVGGWVLLLAFLFAATDVDALNAQAGFVGAIFEHALTSRWAGIVFLVSTIGQFFCAVSCCTSTSRMLYAFSRDGAVPGSRWWSRLDAHRVPVNAVLFSGVAAVLLTLPALYRSPTGTPVAFYAVVSIGVIGLYVGFAIPIWLRLRAGDAFVPGPWTLGARYRWMCWLSLAEIAVIAVYFVLPTVPQGWPGDAAFTWTAVNYTPLVLGGVLLGITLWWAVSARHWFTGPRRNVERRPGA